MMTTGRARFGGGRSVAMTTRCGGERYLHGFSELARHTTVPSGTGDTMHFRVGDMYAVYTYILVDTNQRAELPWQRMDRHPVPRDCL